MQIDLRNNIDAVVARLESYKREVLDKAIVSAVNRCAEMARTDAARELRAAGYNIKSATIKAAVNVSRASAGNMVATLTINRKPIPLIQYDARQTKSGVSVKVTSARKVVKGAFIAKMQSGHSGVYTRAPGAVHKRVMVAGHKRWSALPIKQLYGPSIGGAYASDKVQAAMAKSIAANFSRRLAHELKRLSR